MKTLLFGLLIAIFMVSADANKDQIIELKTDLGVMKVKLYNKTPLHRDNFLELVKKGYFDGLIFHRVMNGFMIQGGDPNSRNAVKGQQLGTGGPGYTVPAEFFADLIHKKGALAAARQPDQVNPTKASSGSQFYIVQGKRLSDQDLNGFDRSRRVKYTEEQRRIYKTVGGTAQLDLGYTVFGEVIDGMDVIDKIATVPVDRNNRPNTDIRMWMKVIQ
ncbi:MAG: peptidylprolyl isomerase [Bacteroidetes bacterium]|nr:peptidylprolyl isomerase [Bacteroidota bacterium]